MAAQTSVSPRPRMVNLSPIGVWRFLTEPSNEIREPEARRRARLLSALLLPLLVLGVVATIIAPALTVEGYNPLEDPAFFTLLGGAVVVGIAYVLSRTRYYVAAAIITVLTISGAAFTTVATQPSQDERILSYLLLSVFLSSMLLPVLGTLLLAFGNLVVTLLLLTVVPQVSLDHIVASVVFQTIMYTLVMIFASIRQRDLEQIEQQARDLAVAVDQAREANRLKSQFLATMSHELRTPLNAIIGFAEVMMMGLAGELPSQAKHTTERIHHNSERLLQLIDDVLDISKIEAGRVEVQRQPIELTALLTDVRQTLQPRADQKQIALTTELDPTLPRRVIGDPQRLEQIILNLGSNAIKFTEKGSVNIAFKRLNPTQWGIVVTDTGIGIPAHAQEIIFEKFRQVDGTSRRAYGGSGLGLAIVKELALLMDGNVRVQSEMNVGSTFTVTLPLVDVEGARA